MAMPDELMIAYQNFTMLALKHGYLYAALMLSRTPQPDALIIGNVTERDHDLANLLRMHADFIDKQTREGKVTVGVMPPNAN